MNEWMVAGYYHSGKLAYCEFVIATDRFSAIRITLKRRSKSGITIFKVLQ